MFPHLPSAPAPAPAPAKKAPPQWFPEGWNVKKDDLKQYLDFFRDGGDRWAYQAFHRHLAKTRLGEIRPGCAVHAAAFLEFVTKCGIVEHVQKGDHVMFDALSSIPATIVAAFGVLVTGYTEETRTSYGAALSLRLNEALPPGEGRVSVKHAIRPSYTGAVSLFLNSDRAVGNAKKALGDLVANAYGTADQAFETSGTYFLDKSMYSVKRIKDADGDDVPLADQEMAPLTLSTVAAMVVAAEFCCRVVDYVVKTDRPELTYPLAFSVPNLCNLCSPRSRDDIDAQCNALLNQIRAYIALFVAGTSEERKAHGQLILRDACAFRDHLKSMLDDADVVRGEYPPTDAELRDIRALGRRPLARVDSDVGSVRSSGSGRRPKKHHDTLPASWSQL